MSGQTFEGKTVEDALARAAAELGVRVDDLEHEVLEEATEDFWGLDEPTTRVRAWVRGEEEEAAEEPEAEAAVDGAEPERAPEQPRQAPEEASEEATGGGFWSTDGDEESRERPAPAVEPTKAADEGGASSVSGDTATVPMTRREEAGDEETVEDEEQTLERVSAEDAPEGDFAGLPEEIEDPVPEIQELLARVFDDMSFECEAEVADSAEQIDVMISGADKGYLVENSGKGISALELILNHAFRHRLPRGRKIRVDAGDFRSRREEELKDLAFQVAHSAKQSGETQETQELNPYERRLVHLALADDEEVTTRSRGQGFLKHVQVIPQKRG